MFAFVIGLENLVWYWREWLRAPFKHDRGEAGPIVIYFMAPSLGREGSIELQAYIGPIPPRNDTNLCYSLYAKLKCNE